MVPSAFLRNRSVERFVSRETAMKGPRVDDENQLRMTGSIILGLIWTHVVSILLFTLTGPSGL